MNIFGNLFNRYIGNNGRNSGHRINYDDKTSIKVQIMNNALYGVNSTFGSYIYRILVSKKLYAKYNEANKHELQNKELNALEKTCLYGYLNPKYHFANQPSKRIR